VVFGEDPYAEFVGDREHVGYDPAGSKEIVMLRRLQEAGIPVVSVFISGRPMWVNPEINASDAFVAAWLPGTEGGGVADVLFSRADGRVHHDFKGRLSYSWPRSAIQTAVNLGDDNYDPQFAYGSGFSYASSHDLPTLSEDSGLENFDQFDPKLFYQKGKVQAPWQMYYGSGDGEWQLIDSKVSYETAALAMKRGDHNAQEDAWQLSWNGEGLAQVFLGNKDIGYGYQRETMAAMELVVDYKVTKAPTKTVAIGWGCDIAQDDCMARLSLNAVLEAAKVGEWQSLRLSLACFDQKGVNMANTRIPFFLETDGELELSFSQVRLEADNNEDRACLP
jgi:beta-glucosidase